MELPVVVPVFWWMALPVLVWRLLHFMSSVLPLPMVVVATDVLGRVLLGKKSRNRCNRRSLGDNTSDIGSADDMAGGMAY